MIITDAIGKACSDHAIYFLLTAYVEAVRAPIPAKVCAFAIRGRHDVELRLAALRELARSEGGPERYALGAIDEAALVFGTALLPARCARFAAASLRLSPKKAWQRNQADGKAGATCRASGPGERVFCYALMVLMLAAGAPYCT
jgi:hypothetical protein